MWIVALAILASEVRLVPVEPPADAKGARKSKPNPDAELARALDALVRDAKAALPALEALAKEWPKDARIAFAVGTALRAAGRDTDAVKAFERSAGLATTGADAIHAARAWYAIAAINEKAGRAAEAAAARKAFLSRAREVKGLAEIVRRLEREPEKPPPDAGAPVAPPPATDGGGGKAATGVSEHAATTQDGGPTPPADGGPQPFPDGGSPPFPDGGPEPAPNPRP